MSRLKYAIRNLLLPAAILYFVCNTIVFTIKTVHVDTNRIGYENLKEGPLLLKPGKQLKRNGNVIEAIGYGLVFSDFEPHKKKMNQKKRQKNATKEMSDQKLSKESDEKLVYEARNLLSRLNDSAPFIYITLVNKAYLRMTLNWICNTSPMQNVHSRTLIISTEDTVCESIRNQWDDSIKCVSLNIPHFEKSYDWGDPNYINLLTFRANIMLSLAKSQIPFILFETDATWFRDPFALFANYTTNSFEDSDIVVPIKGYDSGKGDTLAFDPMLINPTNQSVGFLEEMTRTLNNDSKLYDQDVMNELCESQFNGLVCRTFNYEDIGDGKWFKLEESQRILTRPYIVNNNFYTGTTNKETRQSLNGLWFLATRTNQCIVSKVNKFMQKYKIFE